MYRNVPKIGIAGAGGGGLSIAVGLAQEGHDVTVLECRPAAFLKQSGTKGGQGRLHKSAGYYPGKRDVAQAIMRESEDFHQRLPEAVVNVGCRYFVPEACREAITAGWQQSGVRFIEDPGDRSPISPTFRRSHALSTFLLQDKVIDPVRLARTFQEQLRQAGGRAIFGAEVIGCQRAGNRILAIVARTTNGLQRFPCDVFINAAGAAMQKVTSLINGNARVAGFFKILATPVLRFPWPFSIEPTILQFFGPHGAQVLKNLSVIPVGRSRNASVATSGGIPVDDPDHINLDLQAEHREFLRLIAQGFDLLQLPEPQEISLCCKALLVHPNILAKEGDTGARLVTVLPGNMFAGLENEFLCSPGKLGGVLTLRDAVCSAVDKLLESEGRGEAA